jgi:salicylate hydroxylase
LPHERAINVVAMGSYLDKENTAYPGPQTTYCEKEELLSLFSGWDAEAHALLDVRSVLIIPYTKAHSGTTQCIDRPSKWALMTLVPLERYSQGRVVLAGDAVRSLNSAFIIVNTHSNVSSRLTGCPLIKAPAPGKQSRYAQLHSLHPHTPAHDRLTYKDVYILAHLLSHSLSTKDSLPRISDIYNTIRCPTGNRVCDLVREAGHISELVAPGFEAVAEGDADVPVENLKALFERMMGMWEWVWDVSAAEEDKVRAVKMLEE